jgi:hypothetical protein
MKTINKSLYSRLQESQKCHSPSRHRTMNTDSNPFLPEITLGYYNCYTLTREPPCASCQITAIQSQSFDSNAPANINCLCRLRRPFGAPRNLEYLYTPTTTPEAKYSDFGTTKVFNYTQDDWEFFVYSPIRRADANNSFGTLIKYLPYLAHSLNFSQIPRDIREILKTRGIGHTDIDLLLFVTEDIPNTANIKVPDLNKTAHNAVKIAKHQRTVTNLHISAFEPPPTIIQKPTTPCPTVSTTNGTQSDTGTCTTYKLNVCARPVTPQRWNYTASLRTPQSTTTAPAASYAHQGQTQQRRDFTRQPQPEILSFDTSDADLQPTGNPSIGMSLLSSLSRPHTEANPWASHYNSSNTWTTQDEPSAYQIPPGGSWTNSTSEAQTETWKSFFKSTSLGP